MSREMSGWLATEEAPDEFEQKMQSRRELFHDADFNDVKKLKLYFKKTAQGILLLFLLCILVVLFRLATGAPNHATMKKSFSNTSMSVGAQKRALQVAGPSASAAARAALRGRRFSDLRRHP